jgi:uncharacterized phage-associated protein
MDVPLTPDAPMPRTLTADEVADYLIALAHERGEGVNNMKLQRLMYYAQAWHLARYDRPLFDAKLEAWISGPVVPSIYWRFKPFGIRELSVPAGARLLDARTAAFLDEIASEYLPLDEWALGNMSSREAPWLNARGGRDEGDPCTTELSEADMRAYFRHLADAA